MAVLLGVERPGIVLLDDPLAVEPLIAGAGTIGGPGNLDDAAP